MEYLLLAFSVLLGACKSIVTKLARCPSGNLEGTAKINLISFSCALIVLFFLGLGNFRAPFKVPVFLALIYAVCTFASQLCLMKAVETGSVSVSSLFYSCGFIIPTIWGNVYYKEGINLLHVFGILFIFASFALSSRLKKDKDFKVGWLAAALGGTLFSGLVGVVQKLFTTAYAGQSLDYFLYVAFGFIIVFNVALLFIARLLRKTKKGAVPQNVTYGNVAADKDSHLAAWSAKTIAFTVLLGAIIGLANKINTYLSGVLPSVIAFPVINGGAILLSAILSRLIFKERLTRIQWSGIAAGIAGIVLLALGQMYL